MNDYYPTLYPSVLPTALGGIGKGPVDVNGNAVQLIYEPLPAAPATFVRGFLGFMGFPFVFPGAYSQAQALATDQYGWIHAPAPNALFPQTNGTCDGVTFDGNPVPYLQNMNHNPIPDGRRQSADARQYRPTAMAVRPEPILIRHGGAFRRGARRYHPCGPIPPCRSMSAP